MPVHSPSPAILTGATVLLAAALGLAGCTTPGDGTTPAPQAASVGAVTDATPAVETEATPTTGNASAGGGIAPLGDANTAMKTQRVEAPSQLLVTQVRTGKHQGFERVVFEFIGQGEPGWFIDYTDHPTQQGSGSPITYRGDTALNVNIDGTVLPFELGREDPKLGRVDGQDGFVTEVISAGTFEGRSQFVIGMRGQHPYSVQVLHGPTRLVVDILQTS